MRRLALIVAALALILGGCGESNSSTSPSKDSTDFQFEASPDGGADAAHWAEVWCQVNGSMTRADAIALMGEPTREFDATEGEPQSQWDAGSFTYTLFYDNTGHAEQAYVNELELSKQDKPFNCALVRFF